MNKVLITTLLLCTAIVTVGCEKTYSVAEFKKNKELLNEWAEKCILSESMRNSKNCQNAEKADIELKEEYRKQKEEKLHKAIEKQNEKFKKLIEKQKEEARKYREEREKKRIEEEAKRKAESEE